MPVFRCPACGVRRSPEAHAAHMAEAPAERARVHARFATELGTSLRDAACSGAREIVPLLETDERRRFGVRATACTGAVLPCGCGGSHCAEHTFACRTCGRFACLRHRWSGRCPDCTRGHTARPVKIERYDPFSKERSIVMRTYRRTARIDVWPALDPPDPTE